MIYRYTDHLEKEIIDSLGRRTQEIYDKLNRIAEVQKYSSSGQLLAHSSFTYDGRGNKILQHEKNLFQDQSFGNYEVGTTYDGMSQKTSETEQGERTTKYTYQNGRLHAITKPDGVVLTHIYDPLGRLRELISSDSTIHYCYSYDLNDNLLKAEDLGYSLITERSYDTLNHLVFEKQATGFEVRYTYDHHNRIKEICFRNGKITYLYSPTSLISASRHFNSELPYTFTQQTDWRGKVISATLPNGVNISYHWDEVGRCVEIESTPFQQSLSYDAVSNLTATTVRDPIASYDATFAYDELNQIVQETGPFNNLYAFDSLQNRRDKNGIPCDIDEYNQLTSDRIDSFTYDQNGRRTAKNNSQYTYDALGRLTTFNDDSQRIDYRYDPFGRRIERRDSDATVQYLYQFDTEIGAYENGSLREFRAIHGQFAPFAIELEGSVYSPIRNHRGDICVLLDGQRAPVSTYRYDAFGEFSSHGIVESPWLFSGQRYDGETHLYHFAKREYDPIQGRWLTPDPLGFADGPNLYAYVHNNPLIYVDPYGLVTRDLYDKEIHAAGRGAYRGVTNAAFSPIDTLGRYKNYSKTLLNAVNTGDYSEIKNKWQQKSFEGKIQFSFERIAEVGTFVCLAKGILSRGALQGAWRGGQYVLRTTTSRYLRRQLTGESNVETAKGPKSAKDALLTTKYDEKVSRLKHEVNEWLGHGSKFVRNKANDPIFVSQNGLRRVRFDFNRTHPHDNPHMHIEMFSEGKWEGVGQIYPKDTLHH
ncbi:MAG: tRNA nuclease WapA [Chlamydiae bacterium]|nr:tRNA nuclease WapA [Chlamydiota bacterium]